MEDLQAELGHDGQNVVENIGLDCVIVIRDVDGNGCGCGEE